jgi:hypothetical protein
MTMVLDTHAFVWSAEPLLAEHDGIMERLGAEHLPIAWTDARRAGGLRCEHPDPFDRVLVAQAVATGAPSSAVTRLSPPWRGSTSCGDPFSDRHSAVDRTAWTTRPRQPSPTTAAPLAELKQRWRTAVVRAALRSSAQPTPPPIPPRA